MKIEIEELEKILEGRAETQKIEFKGACFWDVNIFAKDILAMSNVKDGGFIIIGVKDQTFEREGIIEKMKHSYKIDEMKDQMTIFSDPHVEFEVQNQKDKNNLDYIIIRVFPFEEIPVICRHDCPAAGTHNGIMYYRNRNRRVESAHVSNSYDMRTIIELATIKMLQQKEDMGFKVNNSADSIKDKLEKELEGL